MRPIDADAYAGEMKKRQDACMEAMENASYEGEQFSPKEHWEGVLAAFAEAKLALDDMPTIGGWTSVKDKLPEKPGYYLTASDAPAGFPKLIRTLMFVKDLHKVDPCNFRGNHRPGWVDWDDEYGYYEYDAVTHWMPLPEPPEGE